MIKVDALTLDHSWPLFEREQRFELGQLLDGPITTTPPDFGSQRLSGTWSCDLADNSLTWTDGVHDLFGLPRGVAVPRTDVVALYEEHSRARMERLRAYAIRHRRGFTIDVDICPIGGPRRTMRLIAAPVIVRREVVRLEGVKFALWE